MNIKKTAVITAIAGVVLGASFAAAQVTTTSSCYQFERNLRVGNTGADVKALQQTLNANGFTVAAAGQAGSAGMETSYFGNATKNALIKWQEANAAATLAPWGLTSGTGFFGATSRAEMNKCAGTPGTPTTPGTGTVSGAVAVSLAQVQPNNVLVEGSVNATIGNFVFTGNGSVVSVKLQRTGISNYDTMSNVYLYDTNTGARLTDAGSFLTDGTATFTNGTGLFTVAGSRAITVKADIKKPSSGQSVGVSLIGYTVAGNAAAVVSGVNGPNLPVGSATIVKATLSTTTLVAATVDAGRQNVVFWEGKVNTDRDSYMSGGIFSFVGSAPYSSFANVKLYVDGVQIGNAMGVDAMGRVSFVGSTFLRAGDHTVSLRGDVVSGAGRDYYVRLEDGGLMFEDSNIRGVYGEVAKDAGFSMRVPAATAVIINSCSSTNCSIFTSDSSFSGVKVVAGSSQQTVGKYTFKAIGEPVKLMSGKLAIVGTTGDVDVRNVSVSVDGVQVVSGKTVKLDGATFVDLTNLGSMIVYMGNTSVIEVKADIVTSTGTVLSSGSLTTKLTLDVQGQDSKNTTSWTSAVDSLPVTVGSMNASFTNNSNFTGSKVPRTLSNVKVGSFILSTGNEAVRLTGLNFTFAPAVLLDLSSVTNLRLMDGATQLWNQSNIGSGTSPAPVNTSPYMEIAANSTKTFDVYVDFNNAANTGTLTVTAAANYQGVISMSSKTDTVTTGQVTTVATPSLSSVAKASTALSDRYVVGGALGNTAVFNLVAGGSSFTTTKMNVAVSDPATVSAVKIAGANAIYRGNGIYSADVSKEITTIGTDVPVEVTFNTANRDTNTLTGATTSIALSYVASGATGFVNLGTEDATSSIMTGATSSTFTLVGAYPTIKMTNNTTSFSAGSINDQTIGVLNITPVGGVVAVGTVQLVVPAGITIRVVDSTGGTPSNVAVAGSVLTITGNIAGPVSYTIKGTGTNPNTSGGVVGATLDAVTTLKWTDVQGGGTEISGTTDLVTYNN